MQAYSTARDLRNSAAAQRNQIPGLQAQVNNYQHEKSRLENELQNKHQELGQSPCIHDCVITGHDMESLSALISNPLLGIQRWPTDFPPKGAVILILDGFFSLQWNLSITAA